MLLVIPLQTDAAEDKVFKSSYTFTAENEYVNFKETNENSDYGDKITVEWESDGYVRCWIGSTGSSFENANPDEVGRLTHNVANSVAFIILKIFEENRPTDNSSVFVEFVYNWNGDASLHDTEESEAEGLVLGLTMMAILSFNRYKHSFTKKM